MEGHHRQSGIKISHINTMSQLFPIVSLKDEIWDFCNKQIFITSYMDSHKSHLGLNAKILKTRKTKTKMMVGRPKIWSSCSPKQVECIHFWWRLQAVDVPPKKYNNQLWCLYKSMIKWSELLLTPVPTIFIWVVQFVIHLSAFHRIGVFGFGGSFGEIFKWNASLDGSHKDRHEYDEAGAQPHDDWVKAVESRWKRMRSMLMEVLKQQ